MANQTDIKSLSGSISNVSQNVPDLGTTQKFGTAIMEMLKKYQGLEKMPYAAQGINAQQQQVSRIQSTPSDLIGANPNLQSAVRSSSVAAVQPTVSGASEAGQTFASRLSTFADVLNSAQAIQTKAENQALQAKSDAINLINNAFANFGADSFKTVDSKEVDRLEKLAGVPSGYIKNVASAIKAKEEADYQKEVALRNLSNRGQPANKQAIQDESGMVVGYFDPETGKSEYYNKDTSSNPAEDAYIKEAENAAQMSIAEPGRQKLRLSFSQTQDPNYSSKQLTSLTKLNENISKNATYTKTTSMRTFANNVIASLTAANGVSDIAAINQFQKVIDEGAVTRDQDVKLIQGAQSLANSLKQKIKKLEKGDQLSASQRSQMAQLVSTLYSQQIKALNKDPYISAKKNEAKLYGFREQDTILGELGDFETYQPQFQGSLQSSAARFGGVKVK